MLHCFNHPFARVFVWTHINSSRYARLRLPRVNLFIADDVGPGKTIEAGLIARELLMRKKVREIVVTCPPSMLLQWKEELEARFGLQFEILDKDYIQQVRRERGFGVNPWTTHPRFLVSQRLLVDESLFGPVDGLARPFQAWDPSDSG
jgi:SNF2 family DNA or RNA helicase